MIVYRIAHTLHHNDLSGSGAKLYGARWNQPGTAMLYTAGNISLCALELLVHLGLNELQRNFHLLHIHIPDESSQAVLDVAKLKSGWSEDPDYSAYIGSAFIRDKQQLVMKVPSAVIPEEFNFLINPSHPDFKKIRIKKNKPFIFDGRLLRFK